MRRVTSLLLGLAFATTMASCGGGGSSEPSGGGASSSSAGCQSGSLRLSVGKGGVATGHVSTPVLIANTSKSPCTLAGYPSVTLLGAGGKALDVKVRPVGSDFFGNVPARTVAVPAGGQASFRLVTSNGGEDVSGCPKALKARVELPNSGGAVALRFAASACPGTITVSRIGSGRSAE
jgi:hypothetical protein